MLEGILHGAERPALLNHRIESGLLGRDPFELRSQQRRTIRLANLEPS
jgi:hypothetical protein